MNDTFQNVQILRMHECITVSNSCLFPTGITLSCSKTLPNVEHEAFNVFNLRKGKGKGINDYDSD